MRMPLNKLFVFLIGIIFFNSCGRNTEVLSPMSPNYYPIATGKYKIYQIDSTVFNKNTCTVYNSSCQLKEVTSSTATDGVGDTYHILKRYLRKDASEPWALKDIWTEKIKNNQVQRIENDQRFIKLIFPIKEGTTWDGISYLRPNTAFEIPGSSIIIYKDWENFNYQEIAAPFYNSVQNITYPNSLTVLQVDYENNVNRRYSQEVYAENIGLVYKEMHILDAQPLDCPANNSFDWPNKADGGFIVKQSLLEHN